MQSQYNCNIRFIVKIIITIQRFKPEVAKTTGCTGTTWNKKTPLSTRSQPSLHITPSAMLMM